MKSFTFCGYSLALIIMFGFSGVFWKLPWLSWCGSIIIFEKLFSCFLMDGNPRLESLLREDVVISSSAFSCLYCCRSARRITFMTGLFFLWVVGSSLGKEDCACPGLSPLLFDRCMPVTSLKFLIPVFSIYYSDLVY